MGNNILRQFLILSVLLITYFLIGTEKDLKEIQTDLSQRPQFYMENFTQWTANKKGVVSSKIKGDTLDLFTKREYASIKKPVLTINLQNPKKQWTIHASHAQGFPDKIFLSGDVTADAKKDGKHFTTASLWLNFKTQIGTTKDKITVKSGIMSSSGIGAKFDANTSEIKILSDTFTTYAPTPPSEPHVSTAQ